MNDTALVFFSFVLPLLIGASGLAIGYLYGRGGNNDHRTHPGE